MKKLLKAIESDDLAGVSQFLSEQPFLARETMSEDKFIRSIPHWLYKGDTALHLCAAGLRVEIARLLLKHGADASAANRRGATPLHYACDPRPNSGGVWNPRRQGRMIDLLARHGAKLNAADSAGVTPLHRAVRARSPAAVEHLLKAGADLHARTKRRGSTPLHLATQSTGAGGTAGTSSEQMKIIELLRAHGANPRAKDSRGRTPIDWANKAEVLCAVKAARRTELESGRPQSESRSSL